MVLYNSLHRAAQLFLAPAPHASQSNPSVIKADVLTARVLELTFYFDLSHPVRSLRPPWTLLLCLALMYHPCLTLRLQALTPTYSLKHLSFFTLTPFVFLRGALFLQSAPPTLPLFVVALPPIADTFSVGFETVRRDGEG